MRLSLRRVLNLTYTWLFDLIGGTEQWTKDYAPIFDPDAAEDFDYVDIPQAPELPQQPGQPAASSSTTKPASKLLMGGY